MCKTGDQLSRDAKEPGKVFVRTWPSKNVVEMEGEKAERRHRMGS